MIYDGWRWWGATKTQLIRLPSGPAPHMSSNGKYQLINSQKLEYSKRLKGWRSKKAIWQIFIHTLIRLQSWLVIVLISGQIMLHLRFNKISVYFYYMGFFFTFCPFSVPGWWRQLVVQSMDGPMAAATVSLPWVPDPSSNISPGGHEAPSPFPRFFSVQFLSLISRLLALQSGALSSRAFRDFHPNSIHPLLGLSVQQHSMVI